MNRNPRGTVGSGIIHVNYDKKNIKDFLGVMDKGS